MQRGILEPLPSFGRHLFFSRGQGDAQAALRRVGAQVDGVKTILGFGASLGVKVDGLHELPTFPGEKEHMPSTPAALWLFLRGESPDELKTRADALVKLAAPEFTLLDATDTFKHDGGRDLTGYEDGTENPKGDDATAAAFDAHGGSFVALQHWVHDLKRFSTFPRPEQDDIIGRRRDDNVELEDAPDSAHVKRTAQESFTPEAFVLRRSMPFRGARGEGLLFTAFGRSFDAFEAQCRRMVGAEDGTVDALFRFSKPVTGFYFYCPPLPQLSAQQRKPVE